jgi:hypothetical protein
MPGRYGTTKADFYNQMGENSRSGITDVAKLLLQKKMQEQQNKQELDSTVRKAIVEGIASGKLKPKLGQQISTQDLISGQAPDLNQFEPRNTDLEMVNKLMESQFGEGISTNVPSSIDESGQITDKRVLGQPNQMGGFTPESISLGPVTLKRQKSGREFQQDLDRKRQEEMMQADVKSQAKATESLADINVISADLDSLLQSFNSIPQVLKGPIQGRILGTPASLMQTSPELAQYEGSRGLILSNIARQLGGEKGVLTDRDIKRIQDSLPDKADSDKTATMKINFVKDFITRRIEAKKNMMSQGVFTGGIKKVDLRTKYGLE